MKPITVFIASIILCGTIMAQESDDAKWGIKFSGFVNTDFFVDSRQIVCARQGHFLLWPAEEKLDPNNEDINAQASFNILSIRTRARATFTGPDVMGAKTSAVIEGSFFGHTNLDLNTRGIGWVFTTNRYHVHHHSRVLEESNTNYGCAVILWDRIFGTFADAPTRDTGIGDTEPSLIGKLLLPFKQPENTAVAPH